VGAFVCARCKQLITDPFQRMERRIEFRSHRDQSRYRVLKDIDICRECVDAEVGEVRPRAQQRGLL
jgi:hypothetical protein